MVLSNWGKGNLDLQKPSVDTTNSAYRKLVKETDSGLYSSSYGKIPIGEVYVPPWEMTMSEIYGKEALSAIKAKAESYAKRATRIAQEEATLRRSLATTDERRPHLLE